MYRDAAANDAFADDFKILDSSSRIRLRAGRGPGKPMTFWPIPRRRVGVVAKMSACSALFDSRERCRYPAELRT
jgi:hypothetical protein